MSKTPSFRVVLQSAWSDTLTVFNQLPRLAFIAFLISFAADLGNMFLPADGWVGKVLGVVFEAPGILFVIPYEIAAYRLIILRESTSHYLDKIGTERFRRFFTWSAAIWIASALSTLAPSSLSGTAVVIAVAIIGTYIVLRLILLFPAIAVDANGATAANAFADSKGHFWFIVRSMLVAYLPLILGTVLMLALVGLSRDLIDLDNGWKIAGAGLFGALETVTITIGVVVIARAFEWIGERVK